MNKSHEAKIILGRTAWGLWGGVGFVAFVFFVRGLSGAFTQELSTPLACFGAIIAFGVSLSAFACDRFARGEIVTRIRFWQTLFLAVLPPAVLGVMIAPGGSSFAVSCVTVLTIASTAIVVLSDRSFRRTSEAAETDETGSAPIPFAMPADAMQWMTRRVVEEAGESWDQIEGEIKVEFAAGQQHATAHLSICPPMPQSPEIECEVLNGEEIEWKAAAIHSYGVRLEFRRPRPLEDATSISLGYTLAALRRPEKNAA